MKEPLRGNTVRGTGYPAFLPGYEKLVHHRYHQWSEGEHSALNIAETAEANNLKPYEYFKYLLEELPKHGEFEDDSYLDNLLPWSDALPDHCRKQTAQK